MGKTAFLWGIFVVLLVLAPLGILAATDAKVNIEVLDKQDDPIKGASVKLEEDNGNHTYRETTDSDGLAKFTAVYAEDGATYDIIVTKDDYEDESDTIDVDEGDTANQTIVLRPSEARLTVTVVDASGDPIGSAEVTVKSADNNYDFEDTKDTSTEGKATFTVESDTDLDITVTATGYVSKTDTTSIDFGEDTAAKKISLDEEGEGSITLKFVNADTGEIIGGVDVVLSLRDTGATIASSTSGADGKVFFSAVQAPTCYIAVAKKKGYADRELTAPICLNANDVIMNTVPMTKINTPPEAKAGEDKAALLGTPVVLDGSGSVDEDTGDRLTYSWTDSLGEPIPSVVAPTVTFTKVGTHEITLTVSDGKASSTDTVVVEVDSIANCGNGICSAAENKLLTCPVDCPVCEDNVCGVGENITCPVDCGIAVDIELVNSTPLGIGVNVSLLAKDPTTGADINDAIFEVTGPNGSEVPLELDEAGRNMFTIANSGNYSITASKNLYLDGSLVIDIPSAWGGLLFWAFLIAVIIVVVFLAVRLKKSTGLSFGGFGKRRTSLAKLGGGRSGYKQMKFKKKKSTLESI